MEWRRQEQPAKDETPEMVGTSPRLPWMEENCGESQDSAWVVALIKKKKKIYPEKFTHSLVKPIHKKCDKPKITNYKTISLMLTFSKLFKLWWLIN